MSILFAAGVRTPFDTIHIVTQFHAESPFHPEAVMYDDDVLIGLAAGYETKTDVANALRNIAGTHGVTNLNTQVAVFEDVQDRIIGVRHLEYR